MATSTGRRYSSIMANARQATDIATTERAEILFRSAPLQPTTRIKLILTIEYMATHLLPSDRAHALSFMQLQVAKRKRGPAVVSHVDQLPTVVSWPREDKVKLVLKLFVALDYEGQMEVLKVMQKIENESAQQFSG